jgi:hypothetical protein
MTEEEKRRLLLQYGYNPDEYDLVEPIEYYKSETTRPSAVGTGLKQSIGPTAGALYGAKKGATLLRPLGPRAMAIGGFTGGVIGAIGGGLGQDVVEEAVLEEADKTALNLERQAAAQKYPYTTFLAQSAPSGFVAGPSLTTLKALPGAIKNAPLRTMTALEKHALTSAGIGSGLEAGIEAGSQIVRGEDLDYGRIGLAGLVGGTLTEPTSLGRKIFDTPKAPLPDKIKLKDAEGNLVRDAEGNVQEINNPALMEHVQEINNPALMEQLAATRSRVFEEKAAAEKQLENEAKQAANDSARADAETAKRDETTASEDKESARLLKEESITLNREHAEAKKQRDALDQELKSLSEQYDSDHILVSKKKAEGLKAVQTLKNVEERILQNNKAKAALKNETYAQEQEADDLAKLHIRREQAITGKTLKAPPPADTLRAAKGLAERIGMSWRAAIPEDGQRRNA